jgi:hypothetical protein
MTDKQTGGSAFPSETSFTYCQGMTLRDYFAAKAMQKMVNTQHFPTTARLAYEMADEMLKAREQ